MDYLEAKARLADYYGVHPSVCGVGILGRNRFGIYLWDDVELPTIELPEEFSVEIIKPGDEPVIDEPRRKRRRRHSDDVADDGEIIF